MNQMVLVYWTCGSIDEARRVSRFLVQERLVACSNIIPWVESTYLWKEELHTEQETKVVFKTLKSQFKQIVDIIKSNTTYEVPEITMVAVEDANADYVSFVEDTVKHGVT
ncbi:MAG: divalent cation tolerance protein CutA [Chlamydiales bacterium]|nr:divalent-cation tolerance protein CutA [Chlamydiales bacterium]NCF70314.1 divalent cation tolerance protein CutA [Chlamydiales bacterium]